MQKTVLIADDEILKLMTLKERLKKAGMKVITATDGIIALDILRSEKVDALITDVRMPGMDGLNLLEKSRELDSTRPVLVMTGYGAIEDAVRAIRAGAEDYITKPISDEEIHFRLERAFAVTEISNENRRLKNEIQRLKGPFEYVIVSDKMKSIFEKLKRAAETDVTVLLSGETGTGKEVCARYLHSQSRRSEEPFIVVSCAAMAPGVVESELFGHEKGSFTSATSRREGHIHAANRGTLFLDDVDDIPLEVQTKLLRLLEDFTYERVGSTEKIKADVRFVATTKKNLNELVAQGRFREDLMYRLSVVQVHIPPLREHPEEIPVLAEHFLKRSLARMGRPNKRFTEDAIKALSSFSWPGNVRELEHVIESLVAIHVGNEIHPEDLPEYILAPKSHPLFSVNTDSTDSVKLDEVVDEFELTLLSWALEKAEGNQGRAAQLLDIPRSTFQYKWTKLKELMYRRMKIKATTS